MTTPHPFLRLIRWVLPAFAVGLVGLLLNSCATDPPVRFTQSNAAYHNYWEQTPSAQWYMPITRSSFPGIYHRAPGSYYSSTSLRPTLYR